MERRNNLSSNLKRMQAESRKSLAEFAKELGIPQSTLQNIMKEGNTTLDTLMQISLHTDRSLDELVLGEAHDSTTWDMTSRLISGYAQMKPEEQVEVQRLIRTLQQNVDHLLELFQK